MKNLLQLLMLALASMALLGCASLVAPNYSPNYEVVDHIKKIKADKFSVGTVQPTAPDAKINKISLRGSSLKSQSGTFAKYLEDALILDLTEVDFYDAASASRIDMSILKNDIDISGFSKGTGVLEANVKITRDGINTLDKVYTATTQFESSFAGAVAIPKGQIEYPNLVRAFLSQMYDDPAFIEAIKK